jgi:RimJ/RimL family protein N-acetyltransferase
MDLMMPAYRIVAARPGDLHLIGAIELAAAKLLAGHAPDTVLDEVTPEHELRDAQSQGRLWVALAGDTPVGFAHVELLEPDAAHLEEIDVHPEHGRRGLGRQLVAEVCAWAEEQGYPAVTLTTFRDVPWNMPFYARLGFAEIPAAAFTPSLRSVLEDEARRGLDPASRVAMRRTAPLALVDGSFELLDAAIEDPSRLARLLEATLASGWEGFPESLPGLRSSYAKGSVEGGWGTVLFLLRDPRTLVGLGGYKGPPSAEGNVEIGYAIAPAFRGRGFATSAARQLVGRALRDSRARAVDAHTLAQANASTRVLEKLRFERIGQVDDPDDGPIWHWRRRGTRMDR